MACDADDPERPAAQLFRAVHIARAAPALVTARLMLQRQPRRRARSGRRPPNYRPRPAAHAGWSPGCRLPRGWAAGVQRHQRRMQPRKLQQPGAVQHQPEPRSTGHIGLSPAEREVVKSERRLRTDDRAEGLAWEVLQSRVFQKHPYHWGTIGWMTDLNAITLKEAQEYHRAHYAPNNATVIIVGDHEPAQTLVWLNQYYGHLKAKPLPPEPDIVEPAQDSERRDRIFKPSRPQTVMWAYRAPAARDRDFAILEVIDRLLTGGKTGRLKRTLMYTDSPSLGQISSFLFPIRQPYMYTWSARLLPHMSVRELEAALVRQLSEVQQGKQVAVGVGF